MPQNYKCGICDSKPDQLSHHKSHIGTQKHKDKREVFELKLEKMTSEDLEEKYGTSNIQEIVERYETKKVITISKNSSPEIKKTIRGTPIWNLETNQDTNSEYASIKAKLDSVVKRCHDLLYGQGGAIVGTKAQNDIMRLLCLKILQSQFNDENSELWERCNQVKSNENMSDTQFARFKSYCNDITEITKKDDVFKEWRIFVNKFLSKVFPSIYYENDNKFNCDKSQCIIELIKIIDSLDINEEYASIAKKYFNHSIYSKNIIQHIGKAVDIIPKINHNFQLAFIDADKINYSNYFDLVIEKIDLNGCIIADNVLWSGKVTNKESEQDLETKALNLYNKKVLSDTRVETILLPVRDGLMISRKIK